MIRRRKVVENIRKYKHNSILEIGCGMRPLFVDCQDYENMVIIEPVKRFCDEAERRKSDYVDRNIKILNGFIEESITSILDLKISFDFIVLSGVISEVDKPDELLTSIIPLLDKETLMHVNTPNAYSVHRMLAREMGIIHDVHEISTQMQKMQRRKVYDLKQLKDECKKAGYTIIEDGSYFFKPFTHKQIQDCLDKGVIDESVITGFEAVISYMPQYGAEIFVNLKRRNA